MLHVQAAADERHTTWLIWSKSPSVEEDAHQLDGCPSPVLRKSTAAR